MNLTKRQTEILHLAIDGLTNQEIAEQLGVGQETIKTHVRGIVQATKLRRTAWWKFVYLQKGSEPERHQKQQESPSKLSMWAGLMQ